MRELDDDAMDRAYRAAVDAQGDEATGRRQRRRSVLTAVRALPVGEAPLGRAAAHGAAPLNDAPESRRRKPLAAWWRAAAAACVLVSSSLVVVRLHQDTGARVDALDLPSTQPTASALPPAASTNAALPTTALPSRPGAPRTAPLAEASRSASPGEDKDRRSEPAAPKAAPAPLETAAPAPGVAAPLAFPANEGTSQPAPPGAAEDAATPVSAAGTAPAPRARAEGAGRMAAADASLQARSGLLGNLAKSAPDDSLPAAVARGDMPAAQRILMRTHPDAERDADGRTALTLAVLRADARLATLLLDKGASPFATDRFGQTPRGYALAAGNPSLVQALSGR